MANELEKWSRNLATNLLGHDSAGLPVRHRPQTRRAANLLRYRAALAKFKQGTLGRNLIIAIQSDSTTIEDVTSSPLTAQGINSVSEIIARRLRAKGYTVGCNNLFGTQGTNNPADLKAKESRFDYTGSVAWGSQPAQGSSDISLTASGQAIMWAPAENITHFVVYWRDASAGRQFSWATKDGAGAYGSETTISSSGTAQFTRTVIDAGTAALKTIRLTWVAGNVSIYGIDAYDATGGKVQISIWNWAQRGMTSASSINNNGAPNGGKIAQITKYPVDLLISQPGLVNDWNTSVALATSKANNESHYDQYSVVSDTMYLTPPPSNNIPGYVDYVTQEFDVADAKGTDVINWLATLGTFAQAAAAGLMATDVHPPEIGKADMADFIINAMGL